MKPSFILTLSSYFLLEIKGSLSVGLTPSEITQIAANKSLYRSPHFGYVHFRFHPNSKLEVENPGKTYAQNYKQCAVGCARNTSCLSFNFGKQPIFYYQGQAQFLCELLPTDKYHSSLKYQRQITAFNHYSIRSNCSNSPCLHNFTCIPDYEKDTYKCLCPRPNFKGKNCKDVDECATGQHNCSVDANCSNTIGSFKCTCKDGYFGNGTTCRKIPPKNCTEVFKSGGNASGVYTISLDGNEAFEVYCDQKTNGGGWTVFQRRQDGSVDFFRGWADYKNGFGNLTGEFWLGLDKIYRLIQQNRSRLRIELQDHEGNSAYAEYDYFAVASENENYRLELGNYAGTAGDSLTYHRGRPFATKDRDNDSAPNKNCAADKAGAWWFNNCQYSHLNGFYYQAAESVPFAKGINWYYWKGDYYSLKNAEMKFRPT